MFQLFHQPQSIFSVIKNSLRLYKTVFSRFFWFSALYAIIFLLPNFSFHGASIYLSQSAAEIAQVSVGFVVTLLGLWFFGVMIHGIYQIMMNTAVSFKNSCGVVLKKYFIYLLAGIIYTIITVIGIVFLLLPGIFLHFLLMFFIIFILIENQGIFSSLKKSAKLVWGHWWRTFITLLISIVIFCIISIVFEMVFTIPVAFLYRINPHEITWLTYAILWILLTLFLPWVFSVYVLLYHDLKLRQAIN